MYIYAHILSELIEAEEPPSMTTVIGPQYCAEFTTLLEIVRTVKTFGPDTFSVANVNDDIVFNL